VPRDLIRADTHDRDRSLGWLALAWMEHLTVHGPGDVQGDPVAHTDEMAEFVVDCYALEPSGRLLYDSAFLSRPKGTDKSGECARFGLYEALGPCRFAGWAHGGETYEDPWGLGFSYRYQPGEPMGRPVKVPYLRCMATEEGQTGHVYDAIHFNLSEGPLSHVTGLRPGLKRTVLPDGGEIVPSTASDSSKDGGKETWVGFDESHLYNTPELRRMYATVTRNLRKRKRNAGTWFLETTTMFAAGEESVAEATFTLANSIRDGSAMRQRLLYDHRWGECEDLAAEDDLRQALTDAYGQALAWNDLDALVDEFYDPRNDPSSSRRYFLNTAGTTVDAWLAEHEWDGCANVDRHVADREKITLGFDGSRRRSRHVTDATALVGCTLDGHLFDIGVWEQPAGPAGTDWQVPVGDVLRTIEAAFDRWNVVGFYADPALWEQHVATWEARWGRQLAARATRDHPCEWWMTGGRATVTIRAFDQFHSAVIDGELTHDGSYVLRRHALNARRRPTRAGLQIAKEHPDSARKIDAIVAATLAWQARIDAVARGAGQAETERSKVLHRY